jgi:hypothetical protein
MDKIDRIINFSGKIVDSELILDGDYRVNKSGQYIILSPVNNKQQALNAMI